MKRRVLIPPFSLPLMARDIHWPDWMPPKADWLWGWHPKLGIEVMNMRERIAQRLEARAFALGIAETVLARELWYDLADAVLDAMAEPTEEMMRAGEATISRIYHGSGGWISGGAADEQVRYPYKAMIDAAKEGK